MKYDHIARMAGSAALMLCCAATSAAAQTSTHTLAYAELIYGNTVSAMVPDGNGGVWFGGRTCSSTLPTTADAIQPSAPPGCQGLLGRMSAAGAVTYLSYLGASNSTWVTALATDGAGAVYVAGFTLAPDFPTTAGAYDRTCGNDGTCTIYRYSGFLARPATLPATDGFVTKLSPSADRIVFSTYLGGTDSDHVRAIVVDGAGGIHLAGSTISTDFPTTAGALQPGAVLGVDPEGDPLSDGFYARLSSDGSSLAYGTYLGGYGEDWAAGVAIDGAGDAYVVGGTSSTTFPTLNAAQPQNASRTIYPNVSSDGFLARFGAAGAVYSTYMGGSDADSAPAVVVNGGSVFVGGGTCSTDFPDRNRPVDGCAGFIARVDPATGETERSVILQGGFSAMTMDADQNAFLTGSTGNATSFPTTPDAAQATFGGYIDAFIAIVPMNPQSSGAVSYATYLGGSTEDGGSAIALDGAGGVFVGGSTRVFNQQTDFPVRNPQIHPAPDSTQNDYYQAFAAHLVVASGQPTGDGSEIVLYARDAAPIAGNWQRTGDATAAAGIRIWNPDAGVPKITTPAASPANAFELTFDAEAGVPYHLWLRMKAENDSWTNDSVFVQFSDSVDGSGNPIWRIGSASATVVSLEDCSGCGEQGWGWNDNGYDTPGMNVVFATSGTHTIRIQQREDGISVDQIVLSSRTYITTPPGTAKNDTTILPASDGGSEPPPTSNPREVVMYVAGERAAAGTNWQSIADPTAAGGSRLFNPDQGQPKLSSPTSAGTDYFEITFNAEAGVPYHLWIRSQALNDYWTNDSVYVQFSGSVDAGGTPTFRIGSSSATVMSLEDCSGCGEQGWGWNDNGYGYLADPIYFATSGPQTIRVLRREDGISIDQIVLSAGRFLTTAPGTAKNDATIVPK